MQVRILGSAAGGGVPQWNCRCFNCTAARESSGVVRPRTQSSVAVSADSRAWFFLNVSPDVRKQILEFAPLGPANPTEVRGTAIAGCLLTDAELDHTAGLLLLREGGLFGIYSTATVRRWLNDSLSIEPILKCFANPTWHELPLNGSLELSLPDGHKSGLVVRALELCRHIPRFVKEEAAAAVGSVIALHVEDLRTGGRLLYAPCVSSVEGPLEPAAREADCVLVDGTFWDDDEPIRSGIGSRTARSMGHLPASGADGSLNWLSALRASHRVYVHINNTNPMLNEYGPEHHKVIERGVRVGADGDSFEL
jgi:pyrroloquinoline quinone biosynthesis protein B